MKKLFAIVLLVWSQNLFSQAAIAGLTYYNGPKSEMRVYKISDFLSMNEELIGSAKISESGRFNMSVPCTNIQKIVLRYDDKFAGMYIQPNAKYNIVFGDKDATVTGFKDANETEMMFFKLDTNDINYKILGFEAWMDSSVADFFYLRDVKPGDFVQKISSFKREVNEFYAAEKEPYFLKYVKYSVAGIIDNFQFVGAMSYDEKFKTYFENETIDLTHEKYMEYFDRFFEKYYFVSEKPIRDAIYDAVIRSNPQQFLQALELDPYLKNKELRNVIALKIIRDEINSKVLPRTNLVTLLKELESAFINKELGKCAHALFEMFNELQNGQKVPNFQFTEKISLYNFAGKTVYLHFFDPRNQRCIAEIGALKKIQEKYKDYVTLISIYKTPLDGFNATDKRNIELLTWARIELVAEHPVWKTLKIPTFPYYILLDEQLQLKASPALSPTPNGSYDTIEKIFYEIKRKTDSKQ